MRIVYLLTSLGTGGAERQAVLLASRMQQRGHLVHLLVLRPRESEEWATTLPILRLNLNKSPVGVLTGMLWAAQFFRRFRPELVHSHGFHGNLAARLLRLAYPQAAVVSTIHNIYEGGAARMWAYRWTDGLSRRTVAVCEAARERFTALGAVAAQRCCVLANAVEERELMPEPGRRAATRASMEAAGEFVWLTAGRLTPGKDYPNLLRAFARVCGARPDAQLWIAGRDVAGARAELEGLAAELGVAGVRWLGHREDLSALLDAVDGFVLASAWEGMPVALIEAMAMAKPTVATDVGGVGELLGDCGVLAPARDPEALAEAMLGVMAKSEEERARLGCAARERIPAGFTMGARALEWERLYREVVASGSAA
ncbi:MAG: glycosyltransferase [Acidobacteriota bacterium]